MLIKIAKAPFFEGSDKNAFMLLDVEEVIRFQNHPYWEFKDAEELKSSLEYWEQLQSTLLDYDRIKSVIEDQELNRDKVYRVNYIVVRDRHGKEAQYIFDTIAYICNDDGKTLEKCFAGGILNK